MTDKTNRATGKICPRCGKVSPIAENFCPECGAPLPAERICPSCGQVVPPGNKFCNSCGTPVDQPIPPPPVSQPPPASPPPAPPPPAYHAPTPDMPASGGKSRFILPAVIAIVIIGILAAVILVGIPGISNDDGSKGTPTPTLTTPPTVTASPATTRTTGTGTVSTASTIRAGFTSDRTSGSVPLTVSFTDSSSGAPTSYFWDFGDGTTSVEKSPVHTYISAGTYTVTQTVRKDGQTSQKSVTISASSLPLKANFVADRTYGTAPLAVTFTDTSTGSPSTWIWDFGNGQVSFEQNPEMTFTSAGTYNVLLTVEKGGVQNKKSMTITVSWPPVVTTPETKAPTAIITTPGSSFTGSFVGYWTVSIGSFTQYFIFDMPVGNSIEGTFGGRDFTTGFLDGTLSEGGRTMTGTWENILDDDSGTFSFRLTDANHFTGTWVESGTSYSANGYSEPL